MESLAYANNTTSGVMPKAKKVQEPVGGIPEGYMSLEAFGESFHQKLDEAYAKLQGDSKQ